MSPGGMLPGHLVQRLAISFDNQRNLLDEENPTPADGIIDGSTQKWPKQESQSEDSREHTRVACKLLRVYHLKEYHEDE